jgi:hypothetical protein
MSYTNGLDKPTDYFNTVLYTGNGSTQSITGVGFQPDWVWIKRRNSARNHALLDSIRGGSEQLKSNSNAAEGTDAQMITSFDSDGFSLGTSNDCNSSGDTKVAWNWLASNTTASNTDGSITSTVSANTTAGFSIVSWTGTGANATIGHGLGAVPKMIIVKNRTDAINWQVYHQAIGNGYSIFLDLTNGKDGGSFYWNNTTPTSSVFSVGTYNGTNGSSDNMIAYCFAEKKGYSKFGKYTGNGNADGTFIYTGFKPAWVMIKDSSNAGDPWVIIDNKRDTFNEADALLQANSDSAEITSTTKYDFCANGFKLRGTGTADNNSGATHIYMAFAENPFVTGASGIPTTAR